MPGDNATLSATTTTRSSTSTRDPYYDGLRAADAVVIGVHWVAAYVPLFTGGYVGVDLFFVLSGFIITTILWRRRSSGSVAGDYGRFLIGRVRRLYPALVGLLVGGTLIVWVTGAPVKVAEAAQSAVLAFFQTASFDRGLGLSRVEPFAHTWSLSVEWFFYLLWPIALLLCKRREVAAGKLAAYAIIAALVLYVVSLPTSAAWFYYGVTSRSAQILVGCALSLWALSGERRPRWTPRTVNMLAFVAVAAVLAWSIFGVQEMQPLYRWFGFPLVTVAAGYLCVVPVLAPASTATRIVGAKPFAALGLVSYSLYLWHLIGIQALDKDLIDLPLPVLAGIGVAATVILTALSYWFLERPFTRSRSSALRIR